MDMDPYTETPLAIINDWEILTYAIGASVSGEMSDDEPLLIFVPSTTCTMLMTIHM